MKKFEQKKLEMQRRFEAEMQAIEDAERRERRKRIDPIVAKVAKVAEEEALKILEGDPDILEDFSFKKRDLAALMQSVLIGYFAREGGGAAHLGVPAERAREDVKASAPKPVSEAGGAAGGIDA